MTAMQGQNHENMKKITDDILYGYFSGDTSDEKEIASWLVADSRNRKKYRLARLLYEQHLLNSPADVVEFRNRKSERRTILRRRLRLAAINAAAVAAIGIIALYAIPEQISRKLAEAVTSVEARPGQQLDLTLSDGTSLKLNSGARISYPNMFSRKSREVSLSGEAYFEVARDEKRPFVVRTFSSDVEVLGTKFNVDADEDNGRLSVTLAEGSVRVALRDNPNNAIVLKPDEKACIADGRIVVVKTEAGDEIRWKDGIVDIGGLAFDELMYKLEMAFGVDIVIDRADLPEICFTDGRLRISDGIEYALNVLRNGSDFTWTKDYRTGTIHIR